VLPLLVTGNVPSSLTLITLMMEAIRFSETSVLPRTTCSNIPQDDIIQSPPLEPQIIHNINGLGSVAGTFVFPVRHELGFYIIEDSIHHSHRENLKSYMALANWDL
jgi:hypothetical protein